MYKRQVLKATIDTLQGQLEVKDRQIEQQAQTIIRLTDTLAAAQALHAGTIPVSYTHLIDEDELRRDAFALLRPYDDMSVEDINRFTKDDVVCACLLYTSRCV